MSHYPHTVELSRLFEDDGSIDRHIWKYPVFFRSLCGRKLKRWFRVNLGEKATCRICERVLDKRVREAKPYCRCRILTADDCIYHGVRAMSLLARGGHHAAT